MVYIPPHPRMAYDVDGTQAFYVDPTTGVVTQQSQARLETMNDDTDDNVVRVSRYDNVTLAFPELRDLSGVFWTDSYGSSTTSGRSLLKIVEISSNTTTLLDGDWETVVEIDKGAGFATVSENSLNHITEINIESVKAIRFVSTGGNSSSTSNAPYLRQIQLYGRISPGQTLDRLELWHPTDDVEVPTGYFDWGDTARNTTDYKQFRVKNVGSRTAEDILISKSALGSGTSVVDKHKFNTDDGARADSLDIGNLAAGEVSELITLSYVLPEDAVLGVHTIRVHAKPTGWM